MITIAVLAVIVSIAAPSISTQLANQRNKATLSTLENALKEAKAESMIRRQEIEFSYDNNGTSTGTIKIESDDEVIATYQYDAKSTISSTDDEIDFKPSKTADAMVFTVCDTNTAISNRQISVSAIGIITSKLGGTC